MPLTASAEKFIKVGVNVLYGHVEKHKFTMFSAEFKYEFSLWKNFGLGFGLRKETRWGYDGYYLSLYPKVTMPLLKKTYMLVSIGAEYGIASSKYDYYIATYNNSNCLVAQKWIYLVQNISFPGDALKGKTAVIYPFGTISLGAQFWKGLVVEAGFKAHIMRFGIKSCSFDSATGLAYNIRDEKIWKVIPGCFIQIGIKLRSKNKNQS